MEAFFHWDKFPSLIGRLQTLTPITRINKGIQFPSLIGRLQTKGNMDGTLSVKQFPSLIGRLQTPLKEMLPYFSNTVSIPHR